MTDRPIIFSAPMVRALLDGRKTQTRRLATSPLRRCEAGDRLYVREASMVAGIYTDVVEVRYQASARDGYTAHVEQVPVAWASGAKVTFPNYRPSIHMPRWAARLMLIVEEVRIEPLQEISEADSQAEGSARLAHDGEGHFFEHDAGTFRCGYAGLWDHLHGAGSWDENPEVVALTFRVVRGNIDRLAA